MRLAYLAPSGPDPFLLRALRDAGHVVEPADLHTLEAEGPAVFDGLLLEGPAASLEGVRAAATSAAGAFVVVLAASEAESASAELLRAGADACLRRPVSVIELQARLEALQRTAGRRRPDPVGEARLKLLPAERSVAVEGRAVALTAQEFRVLEALLRRPGEVLTPEDLVRLAWGEEAEVDPALVSTYVARLRAKLERPSGLKLITAVRGHGYRIEDG